MIVTPVRLLMCMTKSSLLSEKRREKPLVKMWQKSTLPNKGEVRFAKAMGR